jgi:hypothetical protein
MNKPDPILKYTDISLDRKQTLSLWADRVHLSGKIFTRGKYEASFDLVNVSPDYQDVVIRHKAFWTFIWMLVVSILIACVLHAMPEFKTDSSAGMFITVFPLFPTAACLMTFKKYRMAQFLSTQGQLLFVLCEAGKDKGKFEEIVSRLVDRIRKTQNAEPKNAHPLDDAESTC